MLRSNLYELQNSMTQSHKGADGPNLHVETAKRQVAAESSASMSAKTSFTAVLPPRAIHREVVHHLALVRAVSWATLPPWPCTECAHGNVRALEGVTPSFSLANLVSRAFPSLAAGTQSKGTYAVSLED